MCTDRIKQIINDQIEAERERLAHIIELKGINSKEALEQSKKLDLLINYYNHLEKRALPPL